MVTIEKSHEYSIGEYFSVGWQLYKSQFVPLFIITFLMYALVDLISYQLEITVSSSTYSLFPLLMAWFAYNVYSNSVNGLKPSIKNTLLFGDKNQAKYVFRTYLLSTMLLILLTIAFVIPGVIYAVYWSFGTYVALDKHLSGKKALDYSKALIKGRWWKILGIGIIGNMIPILFLIPTFFLPESLVTDLISSFLVTIGMLYFVHVNLVMYLNLEAVEAKKIANDTTQLMNEQFVAAPIQVKEINY